MVSGGNVSLQYVNSINWILRLFSRIIGRFASYGSVLIHMISSLNLPLQ